MGNCMQRCEVAEEQTQNTSDGVVLTTPSGPPSRTRVPVVVVKGGCGDTEK